MFVKERFELITGKNGNVYNVVPIKLNTLEAFKIPNDERIHLNNLFEVFSKTRPDLEFVKKDVGKTIVVKIENYPLPGFVTKDGIPVVNLSVIPSDFVTDFTPHDIYALFVYSIILSRLITFKNLDMNIADYVAEFMILILMKLFGKKFGLTGSYKDKIPALQFLTALYIHSGMFGADLDNSLLKKLSNKYYVDSSGLRIPEQIDTTTGFLRSLKINNILPITETKFSMTITNLAGISSIPMFEDVSRFFSTIAASSCSGTTIFSKYWKKMNPKLFDKLLYFAVIKSK